MPTLASNAVRGFACALTWGFALTSNAKAQDLPAITIDQLVRATPRVYCGTTAGDYTSSGSGVLVGVQNGAGIVVTNHHVVAPEGRPCGFVALGFTNSAALAPAPSVRAEVLVASLDLDLAIVRVYQDLQGRTINPNTFPAPARWATPNQTQLGDTVFAIGYPGVGGDTVSYTKGTLAGFVANDGRSSGQDWLKHNAPIGPGSSGGGLFNTRGELIGINTEVVIDRTTQVQQARARPADYALKLMLGERVVLQSQVKQSAAWPPTLQVGQSWIYRVQREAWLVSWQSSNRRLTQGSAKGLSAAAPNTQALWQYNTIEDFALLYLDDGRGPNTICVFVATNATPNVLRGELHDLKNSTLYPNGVPCSLERYTNAADALFEPWFLPTL